MVLKAKDINSGPGCKRATHPGRILGNSPGLDDIMTPGGSTGHSDWCDSGDNMNSQHSLGLDWMSPWPQVAMQAMPIIKALVAMWHLDTNSQDPWHQHGLWWYHEPLASKQTMGCHSTMDGDMALNCSPSPYYIWDFIHTYNDFWSYSDPNGPPDFSQIHPSLSTSPKISTVACGAMNWIMINQPGTISLKPDKPLPQKLPTVSSPSVRGWASWTSRPLCR